MSCTSNCHPKMLQRVQNLSQSPWQIGNARGYLSFDIQHTTPLLHTGVQKIWSVNTEQKTEGKSLSLPHFRDSSKQQCFGGLFFCRHFKQRTNMIWDEAVTNHSDTPLNGFFFCQPPLRISGVLLMFVSCTISPSVQLVAPNNLRMDVCHT